MVHIKKVACCTFGYQLIQQVKIGCNFKYCNGSNPVFSRKCTSAVTLQIQSFITPIYHIHFSPRQFL